LEYGRFVNEGSFIGLDHGHVSFFPSSGRFIGYFQWIRTKR
jgi:hypothetical protein